MLVFTDNFKVNFCDYQLLIEKVEGLPLIKVFNTDTGENVTADILGIDRGELDRVVATFNSLYDVMTCIKKFTA
jgi:hypothetical protein